MRSLSSDLTPRFNLPYLLHVFCYINAHWWKETLPPWIPLCCIQKITTYSTVTKERSKKLRNEAQCFPLQRSPVKRNRSQVTEPSYLTNPGRDAIQCSFCDQVFSSGAFSAGELCSSKRTVGRINRIHKVRALHPLQRRFKQWTFVYWPSVSPLWRERAAPSMNAANVWAVPSMWWRIKAGGCAAWRTPSCCCSHSVALVELCVVPFTSRLRIFLICDLRCFLSVHETQHMGHKIQLYKMVRWLIFWLI